MFDSSSWSLTANIILFLLAAGVIGRGGVSLAGLADRLADRTGLGEAMTGTLLLGLVTALPGLAASVTAALDGHPALAISNAIGGIAIQTTFLAAADIAHKRANLEHAAASMANILQTSILIGLLSIVLLGLAGPDITVGHVHPMTIVLLGAAGLGFLIVYRGSRSPMWMPRQTPATVTDTPDQEYVRADLTRLLVRFSMSAVVVIAAGALVAHTSGNIAETTGMSDTVAGGFLSGIATSLPELVTTIAAVRRGALTLAVSDIVGGNLFDVLFVFAADIILVSGSIYHAVSVSARELFLTGLAILLNVILLIGLLVRQRAGPANIGFESVLMLLVYLAGFFMIFFST